MKAVVPIAVVLYEPSTEDGLATWLADDVLRTSLSKWLTSVRSVCVSTSSSSVEQGATAMLRVATDTLMACAEDVLPRADANEVDYVFLLLATFWDGQAPESKAAFTQLRQLGEADSEPRHTLLKAFESRIRLATGSPDARTPPPVVRVDVLIQALNAKKGEHTMRSNQGALVSSLEKKLRASALMVGVTEAQVASADGKERPLTAAAAGDGRKKSGGGGCAETVGETDFSVSAVRAAVEKGQGECFFLLAAADEAALAKRRAELAESCESLQVVFTPLFPVPRTVSVNSNGTASSTAAGPSASGGSSPTVLVAQEFLLRENIAGQHLEMRLAMCGNVDSGKSTLTSVLTRGCRDNGRGYARAFVFNHKHEATTGRTSSISQNHLGFNARGDVVNYEHVIAAEPPAAPTAESASTETAGTSAEARAQGNVHASRAFTAQELAQKSAKMVTLYDLAGHERYLKTTVLGMTRNMPDYACIVISANNGIQRMTKEHLALCLALKLPFFVVITRIDATPPNVHKETLATVHKLLKIPTVRKLPYPVRNEDEVIMAAKNLRHDRIAPIFEVSNVTGKGVAFVSQFLNLLPLRKDWHAARALPRAMIIDSTFFVTGVGTVVGGVITQGVFHVNDTVLLGPDGFGHYRPVSIKSIHVKGVDSIKAEAGNDAALCLKKEKRSAIRKGNILADPVDPPKAYWQFEAEITILYHSTTITTNYEPVIHSTTVRQSARITYVAQENLRTGDRSLVRFHFLYRPEYMFEGQRLIFREGRTKGIGIVTKLTEASDNALLAKAKVKKHHADEHN